MKTIYYKDDKIDVNKYYIQRRAMFNSMTNRCRCNKQASFNYPQFKRPTCCKTCKLPGMINVKNKK